MARSELARGWPVVLACLIGMMLGISAIPFYTLGIFAGPIIGEFGWTRFQYQGAFFCMIAGASTGPLAGYLCDRFGVRLVALLSVVGFAFGLALIGIITTAAVWTFYLGWAVMAVLAQGTGPIAWTRAIGDWFYAQRGLALGIALMGSGITAFLAPPLTNLLIESIGWRMSYVALAGIVLFIGLPVLYWGLRPAPQDVIDAGTALGGGLSKDYGLTLGEALRSYRFWVIASAFSAISLGVSGIISNLVPLLTDRGVEAGTAALFASLIGLSVILGRVLVGFLLDRFWGPGVAFFLMALPATSCLILAGSDLGPLATGFAVFVVGFAAGAEFDIIAYFVSRYFGLRNYGRIYGIQYTIFFFGAGAAPAIFGAVYDATGGYGPVLTAVAAAFLSAAALLLTLGRYPDLTRHLAPAE